MNLIKFLLSSHTSRWIPYTGLRIFLEIKSARYSTIFLLHLFRALYLACGEMHRSHLTIGHQLAGFSNCRESGIFDIRYRIFLLSISFSKLRQHENLWYWKIEFKIYEPFHICMNHLNGIRYNESVLSRFCGRNLIQQLYVNFHP
jgi:hypothetical protein